MQPIGIDPATMDVFFNTQDQAARLLARLEADTQRTVGNRFREVERGHFLTWLANDHEVTPESSELTVPVLQELYHAAFEAHKVDCWLCTRHAVAGLGLPGKGE